MLYLLFFDCSQHFSDTIKVSPDIPAYHNERGRVYERYVSSYWIHVHSEEQCGGEMHFNLISV